MNKNLLILLAIIFSFCITVPAFSQAQSKQQRPAKNSLFIVISKKNLQLSVYGKQGSDTVLVYTYPVCLSLNKGNKQRRGDMKTPESPKGKPFKITQIQDASGWRHDFGDGRGNILAYGHWFLRLLTPGHSGIGIHGSTNNEHTVPGRASEGCIRLKDGDIIHLKENYAYVNMPVIIQAENDGPLPFEARAKEYSSKEEKKDSSHTQSTHDSLNRTSNCITDTGVTVKQDKSPTNKAETPIKDETQTKDNSPKSTKTQPNSTTKSKQNNQQNTNASDKTRNQKQATIPTKTVTQNKTKTQPNSTTKSKQNNQQNTNASDKTRNQKQATIPTKTVTQNKTKTQPNSTTKSKQNNQQNTNTTNKTGTQKQTTIPTKKRKQ